LRAAFEYRGNVTLLLDDGSRVDGYVANVADDGVDFWREGTSAGEHIAAPRIREVAFTGRDMASTEGWEAWTRDYQKRHGGESSGGGALRP
jgi:hypothetical protein